MDNANRSQSENRRLSSLSDDRHEVVTDIQFGLAEIRSALAKLDTRSSGKNTIRQVNAMLDALTTFDCHLDSLVDVLADDSEREGIEQVNANVNAGMGL